MGITLGTQPTKEEAVDGLAPHRSSCCCFTPFFRPHQSRTARSSVWRWVQTLQNGECSSRRDRGTNSMKKIQEWLGLVAGPVWKTLIRKLGRTPSPGGGSNRRVNFRYDLLSYSLNFDEGLRKNALLVMEVDDDIGSHDFSARFPSVPVWLRSDRLDGYSQ